jgi:uncharacterized protein YegP (UPF0339 family)
VSRLIRTLVAAAALGTLAAAMTPPESPAQEGAAQKDKGKAAEHKAGAVEVFKDKAGEYRWHVTDHDGKVVAMTTKGYATKDECIKALESVKATLAKVKVTEVHRDSAPKKDKKEK